MKSLPRFVFAALTLGLAFFPALARGAGPTPETRLARLDQLVTLTADQKAKATDAFRKEDAELQALAPADRPMKTFEVRQASRDRVRALLTSAQQKIYDRAPQTSGGGLTLPTPENKVANLDKTISLTPAQKTVALQIYQEEFEALVSIPQSARMDQGTAARQTARDQVRAILAPEQLNKMDNVRQAAATQDTVDRTAVENQLRASSALAARIGQIASVSLSKSSTTESDKGTRNGNYILRVVGADRTETLTIAWEKAPASGEIKIVKVEGDGGAAIQL